MNVEYSCHDVKLKVYENGTVVLKNYEKVIYSDLQLFDSDCLCVGRVSVSDLLKDTSKNIRSDSLYRSRDLIIDYACENDVWKSFITLTFDPKRFNFIDDVSCANRYFRTWREQVAKKCKKIGLEFMYLGVPEFQKNGNVHYHILTNLSCNSSLIPKREHKRLWKPKEKNYTELDYYDLPYWTYGHSTAFDVVKDTDDNFNVALYITKYLYKDIDNRLYGHTRVLKSNNLKKPNVYKLSSGSVTYKKAVNYLKEKGYDILNFYEVGVSQENPYIIPSTTITYKSQDNNSILKTILKENK